MNRLVAVQINVCCLNTTKKLLASIENLTHLHPHQLLFAMSPLIALFYVIYTGFEPEEVEREKRAKKGDFQLDGHGE